MNKSCLQWENLSLPKSNKGLKEPEIRFNVSISQKQLSDLMFIGTGTCLWPTYNLPDQNLFSFGFLWLPMCTSYVYMLRHLTCIPINKCISDSLVPHCLCLSLEPLHTFHGYGSRHCLSFKPVFFQLLCDNGQETQNL